jgi:hypothetical protein
MWERASVVASLPLTSPLITPSTGEAEPRGNSCVLYDTYNTFCTIHIRNVLNAPNEWASVVCRKVQVVQSLFLPFPLSVYPWREDPTMTFPKVDPTMTLCPYIHGRRRRKRLNRLGPPGTSSSRVVNSKIPYTLTLSRTLPCCPKPGSRPYHQATPLDETLYATLSTLRSSSKTVWAPRSRSVLRYPRQTQYEVSSPLFASLKRFGGALGSILKRFGGRLARYANIDPTYTRTPHSTCRHLVLQGIGKVPLRGAPAQVSY